MVFDRVETYIASGNVVFDSKASATGVKSPIERALAEHAGKQIGAAVRTAREMQHICDANPFANAQRLPPVRAAMLCCR